VSITSASFLLSLSGACMLFFDVVGNLQGKRSAPKTLAGWLASDSVKRDGSVDSRIKEQDTALSGLDTGPPQKACPQSNLCEFLRKSKEFETDYQT